MFTPSHAFIGASREGVCLTRCQRTVVLDCVCPLPVFVNKALLAHGHNQTHLAVNHTQLFSHCRGHKPSSAYCFGSFWEKSMAPQSLPSVFSPFSPWDTSGSYQSRLVVQSFCRGHTSWASLDISASVQGLLEWLRQ